MKLDTKRTVLIGFGFMSIIAFWQFYDQVIPYLLENVFGNSTFVTNCIMAVDNVLAIFMLPLFGTISDKTRSPLGKRTPYILFGTIAASILTVVLTLFLPGKNFIGFVVTLMALLVVMSVYRTPAVAYMPDVTPKPLRSKANAIVNLVAYIGGIVITVAMMVLLHSETNAAGEKVYAADQSFAPIFWVVAVFMLVSVIIMTVFVKENKLPHVEDDKEEQTAGKALSRSEMTSLILILLSVFLWYAAYNAVTTAFSRYCVNVWQVDLGTSSGYLLVATVVSIAAFVPLGFLSGKFGRKRMVQAGVLMMTVGYFVAFFLRSQTPLMYGVFAVVGVGWAAINVNSFPMVVELATGANVGKYTGFYYTFSMAAQIVSPLVSGFLIDKAGFGYTILFPFAVVFSAASFVTISLVRHGDVKPTAGTDLLENFDVDL